MILLEDIVIKQELRKLVFQLDSLQILNIYHKVTKIWLRVFKYFSESQNLSIILLRMLYKVAGLVVIIAVIYLFLCDFG